MTIAIQFGQFVKQRRLQKAMSQNMLSKKVFEAGNRTYITHLENGNLENINTSTMDKILEALDAKVKFEKIK